MKVFVSHSSQDITQLKNLCYAFEQNDLTVWKKNELRGGQPLRGQLKEAVEACGACVFLATKKSVESHWCHEELGAFWGSGKRIIAYVDDTTLQDDDLRRLLNDDLWYRTLDDLIPDVKEALKDSENLHANHNTFLRGREQARLLNQHPPKYFKDIFVAGPTLAVVAKKQSFFKDVIEAGGQLRFLIPTPDRNHPAMLGLEAHWHHGKDGFPGFVGELKRALRGFRKLKELLDAHSLKPFHLKQLDCASTLSLLMINSSTPAGIVQVELLPYDTMNLERPHFVVRPENDGNWYSYFRERCESMWEVGTDLNIDSIDIESI